MVELAYICSPKCGGIILVITKNTPNSSVIKIVREIAISISLDSFKRKRAPRDVVAMADQRRRGGDVARASTDVNNNRENIP